MFSILKSVIWIVGFLVVAGFVLNYFGYEINRDYFNSSKAECQQRLKECTDNLIHQGIDNVQCDINCASTGIIIKKIK
jgi:hypothetical protein